MDFSTAINHQYSTRFEWGKECAVRGVGEVVIDERDPRSAFPKLLEARRTGCFAPRDRKQARGHLREVLGTPASGIEEPRGSRLGFARRVPSNGDLVNVFAR